MVLYRHNYSCGSQRHWTDQMTKIATVFPRGQQQPTAPPKKKRPLVSSNAPTKTTDWLVVIFSLLLLVACIISTIIASRIMSLSSNTSSSSSSLLFYFVERFPDSSSRSERTNAHDSAHVSSSTTTTSLLRRPPPATTQQRRQLYEFVTPNIRDCAASGLLETCPYVTTTTNTNNNSTNPPLSLFTGACPSSLQQMITDNWCYNGVQEVCCGLTSDECCEIAKSYLSLFFVLAMVALSPFVVLFICAYGRCCCWYPRLWNAESNRGCGRRPSPPSTNDDVKNIDPQDEAEMVEESAVAVGPPE